MDKIKDYSTFDKVDTEEACMYLKKAMGRLSNVDSEIAKKVKAQIEVLCQQLQESC